VTVACRAWRTSTSRDGFGKQVSYQEIQVDKAMPAVKFAGARCSGTPAIARLSKVWRTARFGRGRPRRSRTQTRKGACQRGWFGRGER
jgi:hypothetical protein